MELREEAIERAKKVRLIIFDVDGVLTDGGIYIGPEGELFKPFFCRDGLGITLAHRAGIKTAIITGRESKQLLYRAHELHITEVFQGNLDKREAYKELKARCGLKDEEIAAVGDGVQEVREASVVVSAYPGGRGAVREIIEFILKAQGKWQMLLEGFKAPERMDGLAQ